MFPSVLFYAGLLGTLLGTLTLIRPLPSVGIASRGPAAMVLVAGIALAILAIALPARTETSSRTALAQFIPDYQFNEFHHIEVNAPCERVYQAIKEVRPSEIRFYRTLVGIRTFGRKGRVSVLNPAEDRPLLDSATSSSFLLLSDEPAHEMVLGTIIRAPHNFRPRSIKTPEQYNSLRDPGFVLGALNFIMQPSGDHGCNLATETRVNGTDRSSRLRFAAYWRLIYPGSSIIRIYWLKAIQHRAEQ